MSQKGAGAGRRVQDLHHRLASLRVYTGISQPVRQAELGLEQVIHRAHDVRDDGIGRVEDATLDLLLLVVFAQKEFIKVDNRVLAAPASLFAKILQNGLDIGLAQ